MLRALVLLLFLANLLFYLWTQGWLTAVVGVQPGGEHEPERLARQIHPEAVRVLPPEPASQAASGAATAGALPTPAAAASDDGAASATPTAPAQPASVPVALACLEAGPYSLTERLQVESRLKTVLQPDDWQDRSRERPGAWMVYMGRYASEDQLRKKEEELRRIKIDYTVVRSPPELMWGLSLGLFEQHANAEAALASALQRGVRTAHLVTARQPQITHTLRVPQATPAMQARLQGLPADTWLGRELKACSTAPTAPATLAD